MIDICLDIETMGTHPDSAIVAIGAVEFSLSELKTGEVFYTTIDLESCANVCMRMDASTVIWWMKQSDEARRAITGRGVPVGEALLSFRDFLWKCGPADEIKVWGNGPSFDNAMLASAYRRLGIDQPWKYVNDRCVRTMMGMFPSVPKPPRAGTHHNALDDAVYQAEMLINIKRTLAQRKAPNA